MIRDHQGSIATAFKAYLMKKIPKLLLEHDKEFFKYDIYYLNKDHDNKIDHVVRYRLKDADKEFEHLKTNSDGVIMCHDGKVVKENGDAKRLKQKFKMDLNQEDPRDLDLARFSSAYARDDEEARRSEMNRSVVKRSTDKDQPF